MRGSNGCFTCGQIGHRAAQCPQNQQRPQQPFFPPSAPTQQASESGVILRLDEEVPTTIRATPFLTPQDNRNTLRILSIRLGILSIRKDLCLINHIQQVDLRGTKGDSPNREKLLLVVHDLQGSWVSRGRDVVFMPTEVAVDDNRIRGISTTCHCKIPRIIQI
ncbi:hypothetical protein ACFX2A_017901 [Malus domestica]